MKANTKKSYGFFAGLLLAILPKCPFCIMAYSSTVVLCGKDTLIENQHHYNSVLSISLTAIFSALIIIGIFFNYRGSRTKYALALAVLGILFILNSVIRNGGQELYYIGVSIVFLSIWLNGSLISIFRKFKRAFNSIPKTAESNPYS
jgi:hypothetical protein